MTGGSSGGFCCETESFRLRDPNGDLEVEGDRGWRYVVGGVGEVGDGGRLNRPLRDVDATGEVG